MNKQTEEVFQEIQNNMLNPELVQDNKLHFHIEGKIYRVVAPNQKAISEANNLKNKTYFRLIQEKDVNGNPAHMVEKNLIKILKDTQDVHIDAIDKEINDKESEMMQKYLSLAKLKDSDKKTIAKLIKEIDEIKNKRLEKVLLKAEYLAPSIQNQANDEYYKYLTAMCTEEYIELKDTGHWVKLWKNYDEYVNDNSNTTYIALGRLTELLLNV